MKAHDGSRSLPATFLAGLGGWGKLNPSQVKRGTGAALDLERVTPESLESRAMKLQEILRWQRRDDKNLPKCRPHLGLVDLATIRSEVEGQLALLRQCRTWRCHSALDSEHLITAQDAEQQRTQR